MGQRRAYDGSEMLDENTQLCREHAGTFRDRAVSAMRCKSA